MRLHRRNHRSVPALNTAALPDLIFTVLFFFMIVTHMRKTDVKVGVTMPSGKELTTLRNKHAVAYVYVGKNAQGVYQVQVNSTIVPMSQLENAITSALNRVASEDRKDFTVSLKADKDTPLNIIAEVKEHLRKANALQLHYSGTEAPK